jgi:hypothetical protein
MPLDLCSVTAGTERRFSFMSIAMGLMCEVDLGKIFPTHRRVWALTNDRDLGPRSKARSTCVGSEIPDSSMASCAEVSEV